MILKKLAKLVAKSDTARHDKLDRKAELNRLYAKRTFEQTLVIRGFARCRITYEVLDFYIDGKGHIVCHMKITKASRVNKNGKMPQVGNTYGLTLTQFLNQFRSPK